MTFQDQGYHSFRFITVICLNGQ